MENPDILDVLVCLHSVFKGGKKDPTNNRTKQSHTGCASWWPKACFSAELGWILGWKSALERPLVPQKQITDPISFTKFYGKKKGGEVIKWSNKKLRFNEIYKKVATLLLIFSPKYLGFLKLQFFQSSPASFIDCLFLWFANHVSCIKGTSKWKAHHLKVDRKRITNTQYIINIYIYTYTFYFILSKKRQPTKTNWKTPLIFTKIVSPTWKQTLKIASTIGCRYMPIRSWVETTRPDSGVATTGRQRCRSFNNFPRNGPILKSRKKNGCNDKMGPS